MQAEQQDTMPQSTTSSPSAPKSKKKAQPEPQVPVVLDVEVVEGSTEMTVRRGEGEYTIDELSAETHVPSRTIRYYQSKGTLPKPEIRGRVAVYNQTHVDRLELIGTLQDRGLRLKAIRDLLGRVDRGEITLEEWLGLEANLQTRWSEDAPRLMSKEELWELAGSDRPGGIAGLIRLDLVQCQGDDYLVTSPALVTAFVALESAGVDLDVAHGTALIARKHLARMAKDLAEHYARHAGKGFGGSGTAAELSESFEASRPAAKAIVRTVFGQEMERVMRDFVSSGRAAQVSRKR